jgi:hypothetical protein
MQEKKKPLENGWHGPTMKKVRITVEFILKWRLKLELCRGSSVSGSMGIGWRAGLGVGYNHAGEQG